MKLSYPILSLDQAKKFESAILGDDSAKISSAIENAGTAIAEAILLDFQELCAWPDDPHLLILAGKGHNTADAFVAARILAAHLFDLQITVLFAGPESDLQPHTRQALTDLEQALGNSPLTKCSGIDGLNQVMAMDFTLVLDGIYGAGFRPSLPADVALVLERINAHPNIALRVAIDLPSGMTESVTEGAFRADFTYVPGIAKTPHCHEPNAPWLGRVRFLPVAPFTDVTPDAPTGLSAQDLADAPQMVNPGCFRAFNRWRPSHSDKRDYGYGLMLGGSASMPGAILMAAQAAIQSGIGLLTTMAPASICTRIAATLPESMWRPLPIGDDGGIVSEAVRMVAVEAGRANALLIGPGMVMDRTTLFSVARIVRETPLPLIIDASALVPDILTAILSRPKTAGRVILTPHRGEFTRLLSPSYTGTIEQNLLAFSKRYQTVTILKAAQTIISDGQNLYHAPVGGPVLARGGSGDMLAGILLARFAQQPDQPLLSALQAVTWHGAAADLLARQRGNIAVRTTELLPRLGDVLRGNT